MSGVDRMKLLQASRLILEAIGEDPTRDGLKDTPRRFADWWQEFACHDPGRVDTTFDCVGADEMVTVGPIRVWSLCEHHLLPFWCDVWVGMIASGRVLGLSKFARLARMVGSRLQVQERLVVQLADEVSRVAGTPDVAVAATGLHLCMAMRGARSEAMMSTTALRGRFKADQAMRSEFLGAARRGV